MGVGFTQVRGHFSLPLAFQLFDKALKPKGNTPTTRLKVLGQLYLYRPFPYVTSASRRLITYEVVLFELNSDLNEQVLLVGYLRLLFALTQPPATKTTKGCSSITCMTQLFVNRELEPWPQHETSAH